eukprot:30910-Pelagococcus_subviridis.AAC.8
MSLRTASGSAPAATALAAIASPRRRRRRSAFGREARGGGGGQRERVGGIVEAKALRPRLGGRKGEILTERVVQFPARGGRARADAPGRRRRFSGVSPSAASPRDSRASPASRLACGGRQRASKSARLRDSRPDILNEHLRGCA